jgi:uncharacterized protein YkwD
MPIHGREVSGMRLVRGVVLGTVGALSAALLAVAPASSATVPGAGAVTVAAVVAPTATVARSAVTGWPTTLRSAAPGALLSVAVRVTSPSGTVARTVTVQRYHPGTRTWEPVLRVRTGSAGRATLRWSAPVRAGSVAYRVRVAPTSAAAGATTPSAVLRVVVPTVDPVLTDLVRAVNLARATARTCGSTRYPAVPAVSMHPTLTRVAESYAERLGKDAFFSHTSPSGDGPGDRLTAAGYDWSTYAENIAAGYLSVSSVMSGWLASPGHCRNIMAAGVTEIGPGQASVASSPYGTYWVLVLGRR